MAGVSCPHCGHEKSYTVDSRSTRSLRGRSETRRAVRHANGGDSYAGRKVSVRMVPGMHYRRRQCLACNQRFTTIETVVQAAPALDVTALVGPLERTLLQLRRVAPDVEAALRAARALLPPAGAAQSQVDGEAP